LQSQTETVGKVKRGLKRHDLDASSHQGCQITGVLTFRARLAAKLFYDWIWQHCAVYFLPSYAFDKACDADSSHVPFRAIGIFKKKLDEK
jgi:hypothetical protein